MKELLKALLEAKKEINPISKDSTNPFFKSKYFDINKILEVVDPILTKNGLVLLQPIKDNKIYSIIYHAESGESIESYMDMIEDINPQKQGISITYFRRYTLQSLLSLQAEDDDANSAKPKVKQTKKKELIPLTKDKVSKAIEYMQSGKTMENLKALYSFSQEIESEILKGLKDE